MDVSAVAIVLCTRDRPELLAGALPALVEAQQRGADVVVVDSASEGAETRRLAEAAALRVVRCDEPGASRARNAGVQATTAPILVFTDDDCRPRSGWERVLAEAFTDGAVGFATGQVLPGVGPGRAMSPMIDETPRGWTAVDDVAEMGHGANMAFRRTALDEVGGFDALLGAGVPLCGSEDKDAFWRVLRAGWEGRFVPQAVVEHAAWRGQGESLRNAYRYGLGLGARTVKVARMDGARPGAPVRRVAAASARQAAHSLRGRQRFASANLSLRALGVVVGGLRASRLAVERGHFTSRGR